MLRQAPISTLFPYTTLFRSKRCPEVRERLQNLLSIVSIWSHPNVEILGCADMAVRRQSVRAHDQILDRKSTRLNSSHVRISYAVFCLKKKNKSSKLIESRYT